MKVRKRLYHFGGHFTRGQWQQLVGSCSCCLTIPHAVKDVPMRIRRISRSLRFDSRISARHLKIVTQRQPVRSMGVGRSFRAIPSHHGPSVTLKTRLPVLQHFRLRQIDFYSRLNSIRTVPGTAVLPDWRSVRNTRSGAISVFRRIAACTTSARLWANWVRWSDVGLNRDRSSFSRNAT